MDENPYKSPFRQTKGVPGRMWTWLLLALVGLVMLVFVAATFVVWIML